MQHNYSVLDLEATLRLAAAVARDAVLAPQGGGPARDARLAGVRPGLRCRPPRVPLVSLSTGEVVEDAPPGEAFFGSTLLHAASGGRGLEALRSRGFETFLDVDLGETEDAGADASGLADPDGSSGWGWRSAAAPPPPEWTSLLARLGELWVRGLTPDWPAFEAGRDRRLVSLPTYPFERERYWLDDGAATARDDPPRERAVLPGPPTA